jgi:hypothetical protein
MSNTVDPKKNPIADGSAVTVTISMMDGAQAQTDAIAGSRDAAHQNMVDHLSSAWQGADAVAPLARGDREAAMSASVAAAAATSQRVAAARPDAADAHARYVDGLRSGWKGAA